MAEEDVDVEKIDDDDTHVISKLTKVDLKKKPVTRETGPNVKNPNSLRFTLAHIVQFYFDRSRQDAVNKLEKLPSRYEDYRSDREPKKMNITAMRGILNDRTHIAYWHMEPFSRYTNIPVGGLFLISRMYELLRDERHDSAINFVNALRDFVEHLDKMRENKTISKADFDTFGECFKHFHQNEDPRLPNTEVEQNPSSS